MTESRDTPARAHDAALVRAARAGDRDAWGRLYERYARVLHGVLLARVPGSEVKDLVHDVFLQALERLPTLRDPAAFGPWILAIARNRATDHHRRRREEGGLSEDLPAPPSHEDEAVRVLELIRSLPDAYRETLVLRLVEGMSGPEISERTGLKAGSVRVNLYRGMQRLREKLNVRP